MLPLLGRYAGPEAVAVDGGVERIVAPLEVVLAIDMSGSMFAPFETGGTKKRIAVVKEAASALVALIEPDEQERIAVGIVPWNAGVRLDAAMRKSWVTDRYAKRATRRTYPVPLAPRGVDSGVGARGAPRRWRPRRRRSACVPPRAGAVKAGVFAGGRRLRSAALPGHCRAFGTASPCHVSARGFGARPCALTEAIALLENHLVNADHEPAPVQLYHHTSPSGLQQSRSEGLQGRKDRGLKPLERCGPQNWASPFRCGRCRRRRTGARRFVVVDSRNGRSVLGGVVDGDGVGPLPVKRTRMARRGERP